MLIQSNGKKYGFSLAEALITILIIGLVAILSVPLCKKLVKKDNNPNKGVWMATRDSKGDAVYWTTGMGNKDNPDKWTKCKTQCTINGELVDDCCVFDSPLNVRNFSLTAVGGGGGGAGANVELKKFTSSFRVDNPGYYRMLAIGGGGAGSLWNCDRSWLENAGGGGTGGLGYAEFTLGDDAKYIYYTVGNGGTNCDYHGSAGSDSYITIQYANGSSEELIRAAGGGGGEGRWKTTLGLSCNNDLGGGGSGGSVTINSKGTNKQTTTKNGCSSCKNTATPAILDSDVSKNVNEKIGYKAILSTGTSAQAGTGGLPHNHKSVVASKCSGKNGLIAVTSKMVEAGAGGEAGNASSEFIPKFDSGQVIIYIGKGGKGGVSGTKVQNEEANDTLGVDGEDTYVGSKVYSGGSGGSHKNTVSETSTPGGNGMASVVQTRTSPTVIYGGLSDKDGNLNTSRDVDGEKAEGYGAGGGGGGILVDREKSEIEAGNGGDGAPGYVEIKW